MRPCCLIITVLICACNLVQEVGYVYAQNTNLKYNRTSANLPNLSFIEPKIRLLVCENLKESI